MIPDDINTQQTDRKLLYLATQSSSPRIVCEYKAKNQSTAELLALVYQANKRVNP